MAERLRKFHQEEVKKKIKVSQLINRLTKHALGKVDMSSTQVTAASKLIDKLLSNAPTDINANVDATVKTHEEKLNELDAD